VSNWYRVPDAVQRSPGDAQHRPVTVQRRAETQQVPRSHGPRISSASHSASKTRVNALLALRCIRGTLLAQSPSISIRSQILTHFVRGILRFVRIPSTGDEAAAAALS
jgi:hypothetical protein